MAGSLSLANGSGPIFGRTVPVGESHDGMPAEYDIFHHPGPVAKIVRFDLAPFVAGAPAAGSDKVGAARARWLRSAVARIFQGLVNRRAARLYLTYRGDDNDWLGRYARNGHTFQTEEANDFEALLRRYAAELDGYIVFDPNMLHTLNVAQTWAAVDNWLVVPPELEPMARRAHLAKQQDLRGRWTDRVEAYQWAFETLFPRCSKHLVGAQCVHFPHHPSGDARVCDFLVANRAFTCDLCTAVRQRREAALFDRICASLEFPAGVWGWHCARGHEHWAVARAARQGVYTVCAVGAPNFSIHGAVQPTQRPRHTPQPAGRTKLRAAPRKTYIALVMTDGDSLSIVHDLQARKWAPDRSGTAPITYGYLPLLADVAPAMHAYYTRHGAPNDCLMAGPAGAGYTYPHLWPTPDRFLKYSKYYLQRCGLDMVYMTNWNDDTHWQEVDVPQFETLLYKELDHCIGYLRGMGESAFEPNRNLGDRPFLFCGEGIHRGDKDDVQTMKAFIDANPNRPLFVVCLVNISVSLSRINRMVAELDTADIEFVRLDDYIHLIRDAYQRHLITQDLYPNREGNQRIMIKEAAAQWPGTRATVERLATILDAATDAQALARLNADAVGLALGEPITDTDKTDVLAFALCMGMFTLVKNVLNFKGMYVNQRMAAVRAFVDRYSDWEGARCVPALAGLWRNWDQAPMDWETVRRNGRDLVHVARQADRELFLNAG